MKIMYKKLLTIEEVRIKSLINSLHYYYLKIKKNPDYKLLLLENKEYFNKIEKRILSTINQLKDININRSLSTVYRMSNTTKNEKISYLSNFLKLINDEHNLRNDIKSEKEK